MSKTIEERFTEFHEDNPHIYVKLVELTRDLKAKGHKKIGIQMLFEVIRWQGMIKTLAKDYKINNSYASRYARLIMDKEDDLIGIFEVRELKSL